jgi:hypothetical protein
VYDRLQAGETLKAIVTETGQLQLPDGREIRSPSGAIKELCGKRMAGTPGERRQTTNCFTVFACD